MSKYHSRKLKAPDGQVFDSVKEYQRWGELRILERAGRISKLRRQVKYVLLPAQRDPKTGILLERECAYIADFVYQDGGKEVVEDVKGYKKGTAYTVFSIKRKLMLEKHGIKVVEI